MKKVASLVTLVSVVLIGAIVVSAQTSPYTLFEATHYGHDRGNWNVGLWRYYGDGTQIPYRVNTPCGSKYAGGPVNKGPNGRVYWGSHGTDTHSFTITYDPTTRQLVFTVTGNNTVTESTDSPRIDEQSFCDPPYTVFEGGLVGSVNNLLMVIRATAGNSVPSCRPYNWGCANQQVRLSSTEVSNLALDGEPVDGFAVSADLDDDPSSSSFTNEVEVNIPVPDDQAWELTGDLTVTFDADEPHSAPKQWRVGLTAYGQHIPNQPPVCTDAYASVDSIWPPNHEFVTVDVLGVTDPDGDDVTITIDTIFQDEPVDATGDGAFAPDGDGVGTSTALVRAERDGAGNGRFYHIGFTADDGNGGTCSGEVLVGVPKSQGKKGAPVDDGTLYDSTVY